MAKRFVRLVGPRQRAYACQLVNDAEDGEVMRLGKETRSEEQNRKLWPMLTDLQRQVPDCATYSTDDIKLRFLNALGVEMRFLPALENEGLFPVGLRSSTLTKDQFSGLIELIYAYGAKHDVKWTEPVEREQQRRAA
jgi:hypothetical protein